MMFVRDWETGRVKDPEQNAEFFSVRGYRSGDKDWENYGKGQGVYSCEYSIYSLKNFPYGGLLNCLNTRSIGEISGRDFNHRIKKPSSLVLKLYIGTISRTGYTGIAHFK